MPGKLLWWWWHSNRQIKVMPLTFSTEARSAQNPERFKITHPTFCLSNNSFHFLFSYFFIRTYTSLDLQKRPRVRFPVQCSFPNPLLLSSLGKADGQKLLRDIYLVFPSCKKQRHASHSWARLPLKVAPITSTWEFIEEESFRFQETSIYLLFFNKWCLFYYHISFWWRPFWKFMEVEVSF